MDKSVGYGSAPGKVIISGDHSVVYGYPALATALNLRCHVIAALGEIGLEIAVENMSEGYTYSMNELEGINQGKKFSIFDSLAMLVTTLIPTAEIAIKLDISSEIPISAGLGSSAAVAVATIAAIADLFDLKFTKEEISSMAFESEKMIHGNPSGIDNSIATWGGLLVFEDGNIEKKELTHKMPLIIINSKIARDTKRLVASVAMLKENHDRVMGSLLTTMGTITQQVIIEVESGNMKKMGELMNMNQGLLEAINVSHPFLSKLIWELKEMGALGAKLTGAGGGGCMIALFESLDNSDMIKAKLMKLGVDVIITEASPTGVLIGRKDI